jgi:pimeloyl-[acyl-carrier protein] methyl ester esterase
MNDARSELYVEVKGHGPPVVLLHGWGLNVRVWDSLIPELTRDFQVIGIDLPGHGRSPWSENARGLRSQVQAVRKALQGVLSGNPHSTDAHSTASARDANGSFASASQPSNAAAEPKAYSLLGWSLGGQVALELAASEAQVEKLVLIGTTPRFVASPDWPYGMAPEVLNRFAAQLATAYRQTVRDFLELQVRGSVQATAVLAELERALFAHGEAVPDALAAGLDLLAETDLRSRLADVRQLALVIAGQYDRVTPPAASRALAEALPCAKYFELRRAGHAPFLSHAAKLASEIRSFLTRPRTNGTCDELRVLRATESPNS